MVSIYETCMYGSEGSTHEIVDEYKSDNIIILRSDISTESDIDAQFDNPTYISSVKEELCILTINNEEPQIILDIDDGDPDNIFGLVDDTDFVEFCNKETIENQNVSYNICCGKEMSYNDIGKIECSICNMTKVVHGDYLVDHVNICLLYTSPSPRDGLLSRMPSSA